MQLVLDMFGGIGQNGTSNYGHDNDKFIDNDSYYNGDCTDEAPGRQRTRLEVWCAHTPTTVQASDKVLLPGWGGSSIKVGDEVKSSHSPQISFRFSYITYEGIPSIQRLADPHENKE
jgi:hypothetical protein